MPSARQPPTAEDVARAYAVADQWFATYEKTKQPRHLATARACRRLAEALDAEYREQTPNDNAMSHQ